MDPFVLIFLFVAKCSAEKTDKVFKYVARQSRIAAYNALNALGTTSLQVGKEGEEGSLLQAKYLEICGHWIKSFNYHLNNYFSRCASFASFVPYEGKDLLEMFFFLCFVNKKGGGMKEIKILNCKECKKTLSYDSVLNSCRKHDSLIINKCGHC